MLHKLFNSIEIKMEAFQNMLKEFNIQIPAYLIKLCLYTGFDNVLSLSRLETADIEELERFAREELPDLFETFQREEFYGIYAKNIKIFKIPVGHKKILIYLKEKCEEEEIKN